MSTCYFEFTGVPREKVDLVKPLLMDTLNKIVSGTIPIDMNVMRDILSNLILKQESRLETSPHDTIADFIIGDLLYGQQCSDVSNYFFRKLCAH